MLPSLVFFAKSIFLSSIQDTTLILSCGQKNPKSLSSLYDTLTRELFSKRDLDLHLHDITMARGSQPINGHDCFIPQLNEYITSNGHVGSNVSAIKDSGTEGSPDTGTSNDTGPSHLCEPVAIVGMSMRLPGGVRDAEAFWEMVIH